MTGFSKGPSLQIEKKKGRVIEKQVKGQQIVDSRVGETEEIIFKPFR